MRALYSLCFVLHNFTTKSSSNPSQALGGRLHVKQAILPDVVLGNRNREVPVVFLPAPAEDALPGIDGIVGVAGLQGRRVHFDFFREDLVLGVKCVLLINARVILRPEQNSPEGV